MGAWVRGLLAWTVLASCLFAAVAAEPLTLDQALSIAFDKNRPLEVASLEVRKAEDRLAARKTYRYPVFKTEVQGSKLLSDIEFGFERGVFGDFPGIGPIPANDKQATTSKDFQWFVSATIAQPLTQQYRIGLGVRAAEADLEVRRERLRLERQKLASQVREAYDAVLQAQSARAAAEESSKFLQELSRTVRELRGREAVLEADVLDVRSRVAGVDYQVRVAGHAADTAKEQLNLLLGRSVATPFDVVALPEPGFLEMDLEAAVAQAMEQRPELREARLLVRQADLDRRAKLAEYIPDVSLAVSNYSLNIDFLPRNVRTAGVQLTWEGLDWGRRRREAAEKAATADQSRRSAEEAEASIRVEVGAKFRALDEARALVSVREIARDAARERVRVLGSRFEAHAALLKDVLEAQSSLARAEDELQQVTLAFWTARAEFRKAIGEE